MRTLRRICVFCGSSADVPPVHLKAARAVGAALASRGIGIVYGGASVGMMGALADAALSAGGEVFGVIPEKLVNREIAHGSLTQLIVVSGMHPRKAKMAELADAFIALPGGWGTLEELFEVITWAQLGYHHKPAGILNVAGYYDPLLAFVDGAMEVGFIRPAHRPLLSAAETLEELLHTLASVEIPAETGKGVRV
jgi:uncharacterized protein (TIGR00730 family)